jgi:DNA-binding response OmpR family regulator
MNSAPAPHILVVDDDQKVRLLLRRCFEGEGYRVSEAGNRADVLRQVGQGSLDLITLDLTLPDGDGLSIAREIRLTSRVPIVMVTGKGDTIDRVVGLELGADDYIAKPFHVREVLARVRAVLRRAESAPAPTSAGTAGNGEGKAIVFEGWMLDLPRRELKDPGGQPVPLTTSEFNLLEVFVRNAKRVLSRDQIMDQLKGHDWSPLDRSIDNLVARLRKKVEVNADEPTLIKTVRGVGYIFTADAR